MSMTSRIKGKSNASITENALFQYAVIYLILLAAMLLFYDSTMHCDSAGYSGLALFFKTNGLFRFDLYQDTYRGYFFSWFLALLNPGTVFGCQAWVLTLPAFTALIFAFCLPALFRKVFGCTVSFPRKLVLVGLYLLLFYGLLIYTLSDFYACAFALIAVFCIYQMLDQKGLRSGLSAFLAGLSAYAAYNTRPVYIVFLAILFIAVLIELIRRRNLRSLLVDAACMIAACALIAAPQMIINRNVLGMLTPMVVNTDGESLYLVQLNWGLTYGKFETFVGSQLKDVYQIQIKNPFAGPEEWYSLVPYVKYMVMHPLQYLRMLGIHFFNMMDMQYPEVYIKAIRNTAAYRVCSYSIAFVILCLLRAEIRSHRGHIRSCLKKARYLIILFISSLAIVPGAVETRFGLPVALLLWACAVFGFHPDQLQLGRKQIFAAASCYVLFMAFCFYVSSLTVYPLK